MNILQPLKCPLAFYKIILQEIKDFYETNRIIVNYREYASLNTYITKEFSFKDHFIELTYIFFNYHFLLYAIHSVLFPWSTMLKAAIKYGLRKLNKCHTWV